MESCGSPVFLPSLSPLPPEPIPVGRQLDITPAEQTSLSLTFLLSAGIRSHFPISACRGINLAEFKVRLHFIDIIEAEFVH
ncbi:hypothetical protein EPIR_1288 [Erwinia piriflorinigrans CFBP 5888]|uniref:Uncharacterized protein n=1 Tax=Erwinia piriflorinigrans CFBP 5888 TaxID=1161919 RepID=V5Z5V5_9GAMM|nr:hypothetical protein EPIR_1288 [Erwinia piriflorinigrans CFBP 5888]